MKKILVVGDVMLDVYIKGIAERISPEAPVPIVNVKEQFYKLGGAANVAEHIANLEIPCLLYGYLGEDTEGKKVKALLQQYHIDDYCNTPNAEFATTTKTRVVASNQQLLRIDREDILMNHISGQEDLVKELLANNDVDIILISDYGKGACSEKIIKTLIDQQTGSRVLIDPKGNNWEKYKGAFLVKPNLKELSVIAGMKIPNIDEAIAENGKRILEKFQFQHLLVTRGSKGMSLISQTEVSHRSIEKVQLFDVSGAGDTVISVLAVLLHRGYDLEKAIDAANEAGRLVVSRPHTYTIKKFEFEEILSKLLL